MEERAWRALPERFTASVEALPLMARGLYDELLRAADEHGRIFIGPGDGVGEVTRLLRGDLNDRRAVRRLLPQLEAAGAVTRGEGYLHLADLPPRRRRTLPRIAAVPAAAPSSSSFADSTPTRPVLDTDMTETRPELDPNSTRTRPEHETLASARNHTPPVLESRPSRACASEISSLKSLGSSGEEITEIPPLNPPTPVPADEPTGAPRSEPTSEFRLRPSAGTGAGKVRRTPQGDHAQVMSAFATRFEAIRGVPPTLGAKDGRAAKALLARFGLAEVLAVIDRAFADAWFAAQCPELTFLANHIDRYRGRAPTPVRASAATATLQKGGSADAPWRKRITVLDPDLLPDAEAAQ